MIERLSAEQEALMPVVRDEWLAHGLSCAPADRRTAEAGVALAYRAAGLAPPRVCVWLGSPLAGAVAAALWPTWFRDDGQVHDQVYNRVHAQVHAQAYEQVHDQVYGQVRAQVHAQAYEQVHWTRWAGLVGGNLWSGHYAWLDFYRRIGVTGLDPTLGQQAVAKSAGWWWPMRDACIISDRPAEIHGEQIAPGGWGSHRLHRDDGPALAYRDGWSIYAWHGTRVPAWVIEDPTPDRITAERNTEIRRCAIESYGWDKYLTHLGAAPISVEDDPGNPGQRLALYDLPEQLYDEPVRLLVMRNGSLDRGGHRRTYAETVPADISSAVAAAAWQYDVTETQYRALARRT